MNPCDLWPEPYLSSAEIDGLVATFPLYCYFPEEEWGRIRIAERTDDKALEIREEYAKIYREKFLGDTQDAKKALEVEGTGGCRTNPKDAFRVSPKRLDDSQLKALIVNIT